MAENEQLNTEDEFQAALEEAMKKQFEKVRMSGLLAGSKGICTVILLSLLVRYRQSHQFLHRPSC